ATIEQLVRAHGEQRDYKPKQFFMCLRVAICGRAASPPLFETMEQVGQLICLQRIEEAMLQLRA
ncbi:MAG: glutamate--tRNA ligase, partial [Planctomycetota bacterium]